jgi:hypothetical protein
VKDAYLCEWTCHALVPGYPAAQVSCAGPQGERILEVAASFGGLAQLCTNKRSVRGLFVQAAILHKNLGAAAVIKAEPSPFTLQLTPSADGIAGIPNALQWS